MSSLEIVQIVLYLVLLVAITPLLGGYMKQVFDGERNILTPVLRPIERLIYRLSSVRPEVEQNWKEYTLALLDVYKRQAMRASSRSTVASTSS